MRTAESTESGGGVSSPLSEAKSNMVEQSEDNCKLFVSLSAGVLSEASRESSSMDSCHVIVPASSSDDEVMLSSSLATKHSTCALEALVLCDNILICLPTAIIIKCEAARLGEKAT